MTNERQVCVISELHTEKPEAEMSFAFTAILGKWWRKIQLETPSNSRQKLLMLYAVTARDFQNYALLTGKCFKIVCLKKKHAIKAQSNNRWWCILFILYYIQESFEIPVAPVDGWNEFMKLFCRKEPNWVGKAWEFRCLRVLVFIAASILNDSISSSRLSRLLWLKCTCKTI